MRNLFLEKNPFYILEVSPYDKRANIISKAEEKAFFTDSGICEDAQAKLLHPEKRLSAELDWFYELSNDEISSVRNCISEKKEISIDGLKNISKLNATLHNLAITNYEDHFEIGYAILDVDKQYANIDVQSLLDVINACHKQAGMREVSQEEIERGLNTKRDQIKQIVLDKVENISKENYVELATMISEKCIADDNYEDGIVISDVIDQYEIWSKSLMDTKEDDIRNCINNIRELDNDIKTKQLVSNLISLIKEWDMYAQPLQVNTAFKGIEDKVSRDIAIDIRDLAIYLHNEKGKTELSLEITKALELYFAEVQLPFDLEGDLTALNKVQNAIKNEERIKEEGLKRNREDKEYLVTIYGSSYSVPAYCTCCMKPTRATEKLSYSKTESEQTWTGKKETTHTITCELPICPECLEHRKKFSNATRLLCGSTILLGAIIMIIFTVASEFGGFKSFIIGGLSTILCYVILSRIFKVEELPINHSTRNSSASISADLAHGRVNHIVFRFSNWQYANIFHAQNIEHSSEIKENKCTNSTKNTTFAKAYESSPVNIILTLVVYVLSAIILAFILGGMGYYDNSTSKPSYSHNSSASSSSSSSYSTSSSSAETQFSQSVTSGTKVYANIISIFPEMGIYTQGSSNYSSFVCKCKTSAGTTIWVHMSVSEYRSNFDSSASSSIYNEYAEEVTFSYSKKILGVAKTSNSVLSGLSTDIGATMLIDFTSVNRP